MIYTSGVVSSLLGYIFEVQTFLENQNGNILITE